MSLQSPNPVAAIGLEVGALDQLMPMHLRFAGNGLIEHVGPTLRKLFNPASVAGKNLFDVVQFRPKRLDQRIETLMQTAGQRLSLHLVGRPEMPLRGQVVGMADGGGLLNLSLGLSFAEAVESCGLTQSDFSPCDHTVDLLYLREAISAVSYASRQLTSRLLAAERAAEARATSDELTGLANRRAFARHLERAVANEGRQFGLIHLDLDFFKLINDEHGHHAGDIVLRHVAEILLRVVRDDDIVARVGGDEFMILVTDLAEASVLHHVARRVMALLDRPIEVESTSLRIGVSMGSTQSGLYAKPDAQQMMRDADEALYASKRAGRGRHCVFHPQGAIERLLP